MLYAHSPRAKYKVKSVLGCVFTKFMEDQQNWFLEIQTQNSTAVLLLPFEVWNGTAWLIQILLCLLYCLPPLWWGSYIPGEYNIMILKWICDRSSPSQKYVYICMYFHTVPPLA